MNRKSLLRLCAPALVLAAGIAVTSPNCYAQAPAAPATTDATLYSTMPSTNIHRPELAMDGDPSTYFKSYYNMDDGDDFTVLFNNPVPVRSLRIVTGDSEGENTLTNGYVETSTDGGKTYTRAAAFDANGVASATLNSPPVTAMRIRLNNRTGLPSLVIREITVDSPTKVTYVSRGSGRPFSDYSKFPDLKVWADKADTQMEAFWPDMAALLYSDNFITPNKVNVIYRQGPDVTPVAATGGGVMTVNVDWARGNPADTGLTVHEVAHVVQSMSAYNPVWLIEGVADYLRWTRFEPQNYKVQINPARATYHDSYRTTGAFLRWCELNYDSTLVTKLNNDVRFGNYNNDLFKKYTGKDVDTLWTEFITAYKANPTTVITPLVPESDRPRTLPTVKEGSSVPVVLTGAFNNVGITKDGAPFDANTGFDGGGASFSSGIGTTVNAGGVRFSLGEPDKNNIIAASGNTIALPANKFSSMWLLAAAVEGGQRNQNFVVTYTDGTKQTLVQNLSDWFSPQSFPGETRGVKSTYRNLADGEKDPRPFALYRYGFNLDATKTVQSLTLPNNPNVRIAAISLAN